MAEPLKNLLNKAVIADMAKYFKRQYPEFDTAGFIKASTKNLTSLELKQRTDRIVEAMIKYLPVDFKKAGRILLGSLGTAMDEQTSITALDKKGISGWAIMPLTHYVGLRGQEHFDLSMTLLKEMTKRASSEYGIRYFLLAAPEKTMAVLKTWTRDKNQHVRRLASEGCRPRLPWAMNLPLYIKNPKPVIELLELLKDDGKEYVRRSVANNLNDIAKDHPELVASIARCWMKGVNTERKKLITHACRTLIKQGHIKTLKILGFDLPEIRRVNMDIMTPIVVFGDALQFSLSIDSACDHAQALMIDYIVHHQKANGSTSPKVFKWRNITLPAKKTLISTKTHTIKKITTRVYYPGLHRVEVMVNGKSVAIADFELSMP